MAETEKKIEAMEQEAVAEANAANPDRGSYVQSHEITFFNDDLILQVDNQNAGVLEGSGATGRGLVYKRIKYNSNQYKVIFNLQN